MIIDLSHPLDENTPPWPGDPSVALGTAFVEDTPPGSEKRIHSTTIAMSCHCGTHMDAPYHFFPGGRTIDRVALETCCGAATLVRLREFADGGTIDVQHLRPAEESIRRTGRLVLDTGWAARWNTEGYFTEYPVISIPAAQMLVEWGVRLVGLDAPSVDGPPYETHEVILGNGLVIVENLTRLADIPEGEFEFTALPLAIVGRDGSPVRAIAVV